MTVALLKGISHFHPPESSQKNPIHLCSPIESFLVEMHQENVCGDESVTLCSSVYSANRPPLLCERLLQKCTNTQWKVKGHDGLDYPSVNVYSSCAMSFYFILDVIGLTQLT